MNKTTIYLITTTILLFATSCKHGIMQSGITIKGDVTGYDGKTIYATYENPGKGIITDTITVKSGKFTIKAESEQETPLYITDEKKQLITALFVKNNDEIKITGRFAPYKPDISGNPANTLLGEFYKSNATILAKLDSLQSQYTARHNDTAYIRQLTTTTDSISRLAGKHAENNPTSTSSIFLIYRYVSRYDNREETKRLVQSISPESRPERFTAKIEKYVSVQRYDKDKTMPYTQLESPEGKPIYSFTRKNQPTIVYFWSINDTASIRGLDSIQALYKTLSGKKIQIHSISLDLDKEAWKNTISKKQLPWDQSILPEGMNSQTVYLLNLTRLPNIFFIQYNGTIIGRDLQTDSLRTLIDKTIK